MVYILQKVLAAGWILAGVCLAALILVQHNLIRDLDYGSLDFAIFMMLARLLWPLGISWIIFACASGYGGM